MVTFSKNGKRIGRPPACGGCGDCYNCHTAKKVREAYQAMTTEERRAYVARRDKERVREKDRERGARQAASYLRDYRRANPQVQAAHNAVAWAKKKGVLKEPAACTECNSEVRLHAHHDDYSKPLEVRWLCAICHAVADGRTLVA